MERRRHKRIIVNIQAELICEDTRHICFIQNLSENGVYIVTAPSKESPDFSPESLYDLRFHLPSGERMDLHCTVKWSYPTPPHGYTRSIGLEITDPPLMYAEVLKTLQ